MHSLMEAGPARHGYKENPMYRATALFLLTACAMPAQVSPAAPAFDVASVKSSSVGKGTEGSRRERIEAKPGSLIMANVRLSAAVKWAYHVQDYQVTGPGWLN